MLLLPPVVDGAIGLLLFSFFRSPSLWGPSLPDPLGLFPLLLPLRELLFPDPGPLLPELDVICGDPESENGPGTSVTLTPPGTTV